MAENIRELALDILLALDKDRDYSNRLIRAVLDKYDYLDGRDKAFLKRLSEGTIERQIELDYYLNRFSTVPTHKMKPLIRCLLRCGVYQLLYMDNVPDSAVCNEACKLAAKRGFKNLRGFVNGVLRTVARNRDRLPMPDEKKEPVQYYSVRYSMPEWIVELWLGEWGTEITQRLLEGLLKVHPVSLRFRTELSEADGKEARRKLEECGAVLSGSSILPYCCFLEHADNITRLPGYEEGTFTVQDVSSALAVEAADVKPGDFVIDVCAAPGGKSILVSEKAGRVLARDVSEEKVALIRENAERMRAENIEVQIYDGTRTDPALAGQADVVLLDVPCSGLGVIGKKRDIKYRAARERLEGLVKLQKQIVAASAGYVRPGGVLIYSTCTIHRAENEDMVRYIERELGFWPESLEGALPDALLAQKREIAELGRKAGVSAQLTDSEEASCIQLLPGFMETDGFFIAKFRRPDL